MKLTRAALAVGLVLSILTVPLAATAQNGARMPRIGWLSNSDPTGSGGRYLEAFRRGLTELRYVEGKNIVIELRWANGKAERLPALADELVRAGVRVIVALEPASMEGAARVTRMVPIVGRFSENPVDAHLVASFARPGGNITGVTSISTELNGKRLELLKQAVPATSRVGIIVDRAHPGSLHALRETQAAAGRLGLQVEILEVMEAGDLDHAFQSAHERRLDAMLALRNPMLVGNRERLVGLANRSRLPTIYDERAFAEVGGLMAFRANLDDLNRRIAGYVDKIVKGIKPADLPIEQPTRFELVINLKTAKALGLTIPPSLLLRVDQVIE
jgi:putative ABC transport system substrate-binding protein